MISIKNAEQLQAMRRSGALLYDVLQRLRDAIRPGMTTAELDVYAEQMIRKHGGVPSFLNYHGFPGSICASLNEKVVHGIPDDKTILRDGDILSIDCGVILDGWQSDSAFTVGVGAISAQAAALIEITEECFWQGVRKAVVGNRLGDLGAAIQKYAEEHGCSVIRDLTGHGIGKAMHEEPTVLNYGQAGHGMRFRAGMTLAVEPMISLGGYEVRELDDGWAFVTTDGSLTSHYEHTIAITEDGLPEILTLPGFAWKEDA